MIRASYPAPHGAVVLSTSIIPPMTDPLGRHWRQPDTDNFVLDDTHVIMSQRDFDSLSDYSHSYPSGVYHGKCWKTRISVTLTCKETQRQTLGWTDRWQLRWYGPHEDPKLCSINHREIIIT